MVGLCHPLAALEHRLPVDRWKHAFLQPPRRARRFRPVDEKARKTGQQLAAIAELSQHDLAALDRQWA